MKLSSMIICCLALLSGRAQAQRETVKVWADDVTLTADGQTITYLKVYEHSDEHDYTSFSMSLKVPKGVGIGKVKSGRNWVNAISLSQRATDTHTIACDMPDDSLSINIMSFSMQNDDFYPDDEDGNPMDELFTIGLVGAPSLCNGTYAVEIAEATFARVVGDDVTGGYSEPVYFQLTVTGGREASEVVYTLTEAGYGTLILPFDAPLPEGLTAYTCTGLDGSTVVAEEQTEIRANVPLLMQGTPGTYVFRGAGTPLADSYTEGLLTGVYAPATLTSGYVLQNQNGVVGFYPVSADAPVTVPVNRCYLQYGMEYECLPVRFMSTGVGRVQQADGTAPWYDLQGRRVTKPRRGVYIRQNKKVILK